ncbi:conserved hypothetical protein [Ricinus communis]|uniref:Embryo defective 1273 n=1 Tax=Ricinus communis TaxID=3988 RepID=B9R6U3_RICCO|nr:conserved hypothetical protein [Ricinus communis]
MQIKLLRNQTFQLRGWTVLHKHPRQLPLCFMKLTKAQFGEPNKVRLQLSSAKEKLWEATPNPVKKFPWREAGDMLLKRLLFIGQKVLKWSLAVIFVLSCISDIIFSISRNQELMIPIGLLVGCLMTDFLKETLQELFQASEDKELNFPLVIICCFFVFVKVMSAYFISRPQMLLSHVANGGLLQAVWLWRYLLKENGEHNIENSSPTKDARSTLVAEK